MNRNQEVIVGIDPGVSGAICILRNGKVTMTCDMPIMVDGTKSKRQVNAAELANILINEKIVNRALGSPKALRTSETVSGSFATNGSDLVKVIAQRPKAPSQ